MDRLPSKSIIDDIENFFYDPNKNLVPPIYDNGACLFPRAMRKFDGNEYDWLKIRTLIFPNSKIMLDNPEKKKYRMNYIELINSGK